MSTEKEKFEKPRADNAVAFLINHQAGIMTLPWDIEPLHLRNNSIGLAKVLKSPMIAVLLNLADLNRFKKNAGMMTEAIGGPPFVAHL